MLTTVRWYVICESTQLVLVFLKLVLTEYTDMGGIHAGIELYKSTSHSIIALSYLLASHLGYSTPRACPIRQYPVPRHHFPRPPSESVW